MRHRWLLASLGVGAALIAAACAPAAEPAPAQTTAPSSGSTSTTGSTDKPLTPEQPAPQTGQTTTKPAETSVKTSVSGIPLNPNAKTGGVILTSVTTEGPTYNPWEEAAGNSFNVTHVLTNQIVRFQTWGSQQDFEKGAYWVIHPDLAKSWEQSADGLKWTFKFRDGVTWSDGTPFTCADAKFSLDSLRTGTGLKRSPRGIHFLNIKDIQCADPLTMVLNMKAPKSGLIEMIAMPYNVVWPKKYEGQMDTVRNKVDRTGTGPFTLKESIPGEKHVFAKKVDYWDKPFPLVDGVEVRVMGAQIAVAGLRGGRLDIGGWTWNGGQTNTLLKECDVCQNWPPTVNPSLSGVIHVNHSRAPWNTPEVKEAISLAYDRNKYIQVNQQGFGVAPSCGIFHPGSFWCTPEWEKRVGQIPGYDFTDPAKNKEKAKELLAKAGYKAGDLTVNFRWWQSGNSTAPVSIKEDLDAIGIATNLEMLETARAYDSLSSADFNVQFHGFFVAGTDADVVLYEHFYTGSDRNYGRYSRGDVDKLIDEMSQTVDPQLRRQRAWNVGEIILKDQAKINGYYTVYRPIFSKRVQDLMPAPPTLATYGPWARFDHVWLSDAK